MGRKRKQRINRENVATATVLELRDSEGFFPFQTVYDVKCKRNTITRVFLKSDETISEEQALKGVVRTIGRTQTIYYHKYYSTFPELCKEFAIVSATHAIDARHSTSMIRYDLQAITKFLEFVESEGKNVKSFCDFNFDLMVEYRAYIRGQSFSNSSQYKGGHYHPIKRFLDMVMGTSRGPEKFEIPLYQTDSDSRKRPSYSDMVMYQIIAAAYYDCIRIQEEYNTFARYVDQGTPVIRVKSAKKPISWTLENFAWFFVNTMKLKRPPYTNKDREDCKLTTLGTHIKRRFGVTFNEHVQSRSDEEWIELAKKGTNPRNLHKALVDASMPDLAASWREEASFITHGYEQIGAGKRGQTWSLARMKNRAKDDLQELVKPPFSEALNVALTQREVATRDTLLPFYLLFSIFTGRNTEVINRWKRINNKGRCILSIADNADPLDDNSVVIESWKYRGKRPNMEADDVSIPIDDLLYELLEFLVKYTKPAADHITSSDLWTYLDYNGSGKVANMHKNHGKAIGEFCDRHDIRCDDGERLDSINVNLFRKVYLTKELLEHIGQHESFEELAGDLQSKAGHKSFDTTFSKYLNNDTTLQSIDTAIVVLQEKFLDESKSYCLLMDDVERNTPRIGRPTIQCRCAPYDPEQPEQSDKPHDCEDYDHCLGCSRSRVYEEHLPRICARINQYMKKRAELDEDVWNLKFHDKYHRANDVLNKWSKVEQVENARQLANSGTIVMPGLD